MPYNKQLTNLDRSVMPGNIKLQLWRINLANARPIDQFIVCKYSGCARHVVAENRERIAFIIAKGPHG